MAEQGGKDFFTAFAHPPMIHPQIVHTQRLRFTCTTAGAQVVSATNLLDAFLVATSTTVGYQIFDAVKVKSVEMWTFGSASTSPATISMTFPNGTTGAAGDARVYADTSVGFTVGHIRAKPSKQSAAANFQTSTAFTMFELVQCPVGTIIDVDVVYRNTDVAPTAATNALVGATAGQFYYRGLDGLAVATTKFPSSGYRVI